MLNLRQQPNLKFDKNLYNFEKKRQLVDNKVKEKEKENDRESIVLNSMEKETKNKSSQKKIQINFQNSFVNKQTHDKYDKIIENNIKKNNEKFEKIIEKEMQKVEDVVNLISKVEASDVTLKNKNKILSEKNINMVVPKLDDINITNLNNDSNNLRLNINNTTVNANNESEMILIEEVSYFGSKLNDTNNNTALDRSNIKCENNENYQLNNKYDTFSIIDETLKCESEEENYIIEKNLIEEEILISENIIEEPAVNDKQNPNFEETYDKFLEDTNDNFNNKDTKDTLQNLLRNQMKSIVSNMKERKRDKESIMSEKKRFLLNNLIVNTQDEENKIGDNNKINFKEEKGSNSPKKTEVAQVIEVMTFGKDNIKKFNNDNPLQNIEKNYTDDFINYDINYNQEVMNENDLTSIHQTIHEESKNEKKKMIESRNFDLNEFIKQNTRDEIVCDDITNYKDDEENHKSENVHNNNNNKNYNEEELKYHDILLVDNGNKNYNIRKKDSRQDDRLLVFENDEDPLI